MAHWHMRAQVIELGVVDMGDNFVTYHGVKVVTPNGKRTFIGKVMIHNEINALFRETEGQFVELYLSGPGGQNPALLYGMKTEVEDSYNKASPFYAEKAQWGGYLVMSFAACFLLIGFVMVPVCLFALDRLAKWDPPSRKVFDAHRPPAGTGEDALLATGQVERKAA